MSALLQGGAVVCTALALLAGAVVLLRTGSLRVALAALLELLLAAGLLRLADNPGWAQIAVTAVVVVLRRAVVVSLSPVTGTPA